MYPMGAVVDSVHRKAATANTVPSFQYYYLVAPLTQRTSGSDASQPGADHDDAFGSTGIARDFPVSFGVLHQKSPTRGIFTNPSNLGLNLVAVCVWTGLEIEPCGCFRMLIFAIATQGRVC
jgi:hypothetical protein